MKMVNAIPVRNLPVLNFAYLLPELSTDCVNGKRREISITPHGKTMQDCLGFSIPRLSLDSGFQVLADSPLSVELGLRILTLSRIPDSKAPDFGIRILFT